MIKTLRFIAVIPEPIGYELKQQLKIRQLRKIYRQLRIKKD